MTIIQMLLGGATVAELLRQELRHLAHEWMVDSYYDWVNHPERVSTKVELVRGRRRWVARIYASYRSNDWEKAEDVRLSELLPYGVDVGAFLRAIDYRLEREPAARETTCGQQKRLVANAA